LECHWHGGNQTVHTLVRPVARLKALSTYTALIERAAALNRAGNGCTAIAAILNQEAWRPPKRRDTFNPAMVRRLLTAARVVQPSPRRPRALPERQPDEWTHCLTWNAPGRGSAETGMRRISMATRDELIRAVSERYGRASREDRGRILDEFAAVTGLHRKHAVRLLRGGAPDRRCGPRPGRRVYDVAVRQALIVVWEASDRVCGKRLRPLVPLLIDAMERHGHLQLAPEVRGRLLAMSVATIDRARREVRGQAGKGRRRASPSAGVRRSVPVRTFADWDDPAPGGVGALGWSRDSRMLFLLWFEHPDAMQAQRRSPSPHPEDVVQGAELAGL